MIMDKTPKLEIREIFCAKAGNDWSRCFHGTIRRETDSDGNPVVIGRIKVGDGFILAQAANQDVLGEHLDELALMVLDMGLHDNEGLSTLIAGTEYFLN